MNKLASSDRSVLLRLASRLPAGSDERRTILSGLRLAETEEKEEDGKTEDSSKEEGKKKASAPGWSPVVARPLPGWHMSCDATNSEGWDPNEIEVTIEMKVPPVSTFNVSQEKGLDDLNMLTSFVGDFFKSIRRKAGLRVASIARKQGKLTQLLASEGIRTAGRQLYPDDCKPGKTYKLGYRSNVWNSTFIKWSLDSDGPRMHFRDTDGGMEWEAYMYHGFMAVGSSADKLLVLGEVSG
jgi:hypothetical protein